MICQPLPTVLRGERCWMMGVACEPGLTCRWSHPLIEPAYCCE